jgi:acetyl-CoA synthetase
MTDRNPVSGNSASSRNPIPAPIWFPGQRELTDSNLARWMAELGVSDYGEFHRWTVQQRAAFWEQAATRLQIRFDQPPTRTLDLSQGVARAAWFPEARLNIANSCFLAADDSPAIVSAAPGRELRQWSVKQLHQNASRVANGLVDAGFKVGDSIAVFMPMTDWSIAIYLGIVMAGCHVVSIADSFAPPEIATRLRIAGAKAVFTYDVQVRAGKKLTLFRRLAEAADLPAVVIAASGVLEVDLREQDWEWNEFLVDRDFFQSVSCFAQETINVLFSSGTTGDPKAIPWNQLTPIKCAIDGYCHHDIQPGDVCAWPTNLGWMMGPWLIFASLINRATIALYEDAPMGAGFGAFVQDAEVTMLGVVPTIVKAWQRSGDMESFDWSSIRTFSSTGESSQAPTMTYLSSLGGGKPIIEYCGGTEIGGGYVSSVVVLPNVPAAFNTPAVGLDFVLLEPTAERGQPAGYQIADEGEVFLVPPSIGLSNRLINRDHFETYYADTPRIPGYDQLRRHGDFFCHYKTEHGPVFVAGGRIDDTMNLGGIKVASAEIERVLNQVCRRDRNGCRGSPAGTGPRCIVGICGLPSR